MVPLYCHLKIEVVERLLANIDYIASVVEQLIEKHDTRDPYELCRAMRIKVRYKDCENLLKAYFVIVSRIKSIVINNRIHSAVQRILLAHELGHAVLHKELALLRGFQEFELFDANDPTEYEANLFAAELLIADAELLALLNDDDKSFFSVARELSIPAELLDFKFRVMKRKGYRIEAPYISQSDFLKNDIHGCYDVEY